MRPRLGAPLALTAFALAGILVTGGPDPMHTSGPHGADSSALHPGAPVVFGLPHLDPALLRHAELEAPVVGAPGVDASVPRTFDDADVIGAVQAVPAGYEYYFTRAAYSGRGGGWGWGGRGRGSWATDFPEAEYFFTALLRRLIDIDVYEDPNPIELDDPKLRRFPFLYFVEPGQMSLSPSEIEGLRSYLEAGGFIMLDDFWGTRETRVVEDQLRRVLPGLPIEEIPLDHPLFHTVYDIEEIRQVPNITNGRRGGRTDEGDNSEIPRVRGIFNEKGRLIVVINQNTDLGDAWEWGEDPWYPLEYSTYATEVGINTVVYAMSH